MTAARITDARLTIEDSLAVANGRDGSLDSPEVSAELRAVPGVACHPGDAHEACVDHPGMPGRLGCCCAPLPAAACRDALGAAILPG